MEILCGAYESWEGKSGQKTLKTVDIQIRGGNLSQEFIIIAFIVLIFGPILYHAVLIFYWAYSRVLKGENSQRLKVNHAMVNLWFGRSPWGADNRCLHTGRIPGGVK